MKFDRILLVRLDHLGDMIWNLEAIRAIRLEFPDAKITVLIGIWNVDMLKNNKDIDEMLVYNSSTFIRNSKQKITLNHQLSILKVLLSRKFDLVVGFRDDFFTILVSLLIWPKARLDRGTVRIYMKFQQCLRNFTKTPKNRIVVHEYFTNLSIIASLVSQSAKSEAKDLIVFTSEEIGWLVHFLDVNAIEMKKYVVFHPGASWKYRRWNVDNFKRIGSFIKEQYGMKAIIIGSEDEKEIGFNLVFGQTDTYVNTVGTIDIRKAVLLITHARLAVCNDSGPMHIAAIMGIPTIALLGPQEKERFGPVGKHVVTFHKKLECHPCSQTICKYPLNPCVNLNSVDDVITGIRLLLSQK